MLINMERLTAAKHLTLTYLEIVRGMDYRSYWLISLPNTGQHGNMEKTARDQSRDIYLHPKPQFWHTRKSKHKSKEPAGDAQARSVAKIT